MQPLTGTGRQDRHRSSAFADTGRNQCVKRTKIESQRLNTKTPLLVAVLGAGTRSSDSPFDCSTHVHFHRFEFEVELQVVLEDFDGQLE